MTITLPREQQEWLEAQVRAGVFSSVEEAVVKIVGEHMLLDIDDMAWAKPMVDEAMASLDRGDGSNFDDYRARMDQRFGKIDR